MTRNAKNEVRSMIKTSHREGRDAYCDGLKEEDCPYHDGVDMENWLEDYRDAKEHDPLLDEEDLI